MKIENKRVQSSTDGEVAFQAFVETLGKLEPGQSFVIGNIPAHYRVAISVAQTLLSRKFATRKVGDKFRVGVVEA